MSLRSVLIYNLHILHVETMFRNKGETLRQLAAGMHNFSLKNLNYNVIAKNICRVQHLESMTCVN